MKTLLLLRHAKSSWHDDNLADHQRPLNPRGERDAPRVGQWLAAKQLQPAAIFSSTAVRAVETIRRVCAAGDLSADVEYLDELYLATPQAYLEPLRQLGPKLPCALVVGHNPGLEELVSQLTGEDETMPTAALAVIELPIDRWSDLKLDTRGRLTALFRPKEAG